MKPVRFTLRLFGYVAAAAFIASSLATQYVRADLIGQAAPDFTLTNAVTGTNTTLASIKSDRQATVIVFIGVQCPVSNAYNDRYIALAAEYSSKGVQFVAINSNQNESVEKVANHARQNKFTFPVLKDPVSAVADAYGANHTPEAFVIDSRGNIVYHGRIDDSQDPDSVQSHDLANALDDILAGKPVSKPETKAFGCSIKRHK